VYEVCHNVQGMSPTDVLNSIRLLLSSFRRAGTDLAAGSCMISFITDPSLFLWFPGCDLQVDMAAFLFKSCCGCHSNEVQILRRMLDLFRTHDVTLTSVTYADSILSGCPLTGLLERHPLILRINSMFGHINDSGYIIQHT
jgi:hypothetical protein